LADAPEKDSKMEGIYKRGKDVFVPGGFETGGKGSKIFCFTHRERWDRQGRGIGRNQPQPSQILMSVSKKAKKDGRVRRSGKAGKENGNGRKLDHGGGNQAQKQRSLQVAFGLYSDFTHRGDFAGKMTQRGTSKGRLRKGKHRGDGNSKKKIRERRIRLTNGLRRKTKLGEGAWFGRGG